MITDCSVYSLVNRSLAAGCVWSIGILKKVLYLKPQTPKSIISVKSTIGNSTIILQ